MSVYRGTFGQLVRITKGVLLPSFNIQRTFVAHNARNVETRSSLGLSHGAVAYVTVKRVVMSLKSQCPISVSEKDSPRFILVSNVVTSFDLIEDVISLLSFVMIDKIM